jgi:nucleotide-binding universal stress UspA family protein
VDESQIYYAMEGAGLFMDVHKRLREESRRILERARTVAARRRLEPTMVMRETAGGSVARAIVQEARKQRADLIILGTHGRRGVRRLVMGSDAEEVVRGAPVPVLLVRAGQ